MAAMTGEKAAGKTQTKAKAKAINSTPVKTPVDALSLQALVRRFAILGVMAAAAPHAPQDVLTCARAACSLTGNARRLQEQHRPEIRERGSE